MRLELLVLLVLRMHQKAKQHGLSVFVPVAQTPVLTGA